MVGIFQSGKGEWGKIEYRIIKPKRNKSTFHFTMHDNIPTILAETWSDENLIVLFSLPRSGSTLLQRILAADERIASTAESWLLLPLFYSLREGNTFSEYGHSSAANAIRDFSRHLPRGEADYRRAVAQSALHLFRKVSPRGVRYYLEKTPRNALIAEEIIETFPNARYLFLWRNPLAVAASMIETFGRGRWNLYRFEIDLYEGLDRLVRAVSLPVKNKLVLRYEDLLQSPRDAVLRLSTLLGLDLDEDILRKFSRIHLRGQMGDPTGVQQYKDLSTAPIDKWKETLATPLRRRWARRYLDWIGPKRLEAMGYDCSELVQVLQGLDVRAFDILSDSVRFLYGFSAGRLPMSIIRLRRNCAKRYKGNWLS